MIRVQIFRGRGSAKNQWRWRLVAKNGRKIASSGEAFYDKSGAQKALKRVLEDVADVYTAFEISGKLNFEIVDLQKHKSKRKGRA